MVVIVDIVHYYIFSMSLPLSAWCESVLILFTFSLSFFFLFILFLGMVVKDIGDAQGLKLLPELSTMIDLYSREYRLSEEDKVKRKRLMICLNSRIFFS